MIKEDLFIYPEGKPNTELCKGCKEFRLMWFSSHPHLREGCCIASRAIIDMSICPMRDIDALSRWIKKAMQEGLKPSPWRKKKDEEEYIKDGQDIVMGALYPHTLSCNKP